jgi:hypothetical protein
LPAEEAALPVDDELAAVPSLETADEALGVLLNVWADAPFDLALLGGGAGVVSTVVVELLLGAGAGGGGAATVVDELDDAGVGSGAAPITVVVGGGAVGVVLLTLICVGSGAGFERYTPATISRTRTTTPSRT